MVFSSSVFLFIFLPITIGGYYIINDKLKNGWLLLLSLIFYSWGEPKYVLLMIISVIINYFYGLLLAKVNKLRVFTLVIAILTDLGILIYFKYFNFFLHNINMFTQESITLKEIALPIGISFYTFQIMSYVIDVYRGNAKPQKNLFNLMLYITLFPQLIAGPIVRYIDIEKQINDRTVNISSFADGARLFMIGFSKKVLVADKISLLADNSFKMQDRPFLLGWIGLTAYALQIYFDFSGYSDMACGIAKMFGFKFINNFNYPYISKSIKEFWKRWHISLSTWFKDYVYIPLGGSRCSAKKSYFNLLIVFFLTGFWHGASWNFIVWGLYYAIFLIIERVFLERLLLKANTIVARVYTLLVVLIGWVFFRANNLKEAISYLASMFRFSPEDISYSLTFINKELLFIFIVGVTLSTPIIESIKKRYNNMLTSCILDVSTLIAFILALLYMTGSDFSPFLYFRF